MLKMRVFFKKNHKKIVHMQNFRRFDIFSSWLDGFEITCASLSKKKHLIFFKKLKFAFLSPKVVKLLKSLLKQHLFFSSLKCTYLGKISFQYH